MNESVSLGWRGLTIGLLAGLLINANALATELAGGRQPLARLPETVPYQDCFEQAALEHSIPVVLLAAVARVESAFDPGAVSHKNAVGVMQILWPGTAAHLGIHRRSDLFVPCVSIEAGARYLRELHDQFRNTELALGAYNMGPARIEAAGRTLPRAAREYVALVTRALARFGHELAAVRISDPGSSERPHPSRAASAYGGELAFRMPSRERAEATVRGLHSRGHTGARVRETGSSFFVVVPR